LPGCCTAFLQVLVAKAGAQMSGDAKSSSSKNFQPPKWCCAPKDYEKHTRMFCWAAGSDGVGVGAPSKSLPLSDGISIGSKAFYTIGRDAAADVRLVGELASRLHAAVLQDAEGRKFLVDLKSTHGTFISGRRLAPHEATRWSTGEPASFGSGPKAEVAELRGAQGRRRKRESSGDEEGPLSQKQHHSDDAASSLYDGLPDASHFECVQPRSEAIRPEPLPVVADPTKIIFLDVDGVLRPVHGRPDFAQNVRTMVVEGVRVPLLGSGEAKAGLIGLDFWPLALRALRHIVQKTTARIVLSSDWRKQEELMDGIGGQLEEYRIPGLYGVTPDLDQATAGVVKALHASFREKRSKEIRKWLRQHPKVERFVAIDDIDLSAPSAQATGPLLDPNSEFIRCSPTVGLTMELARLAVCYLNGVPVTEEEVQAAYGADPHGPLQVQAAAEIVPMSMGLDTVPGLTPG